MRSFFFLRADASCIRATIADARSNSRSWIAETRFFRAASRESLITTTPPAACSIAARTEEAAGERWSAGQQPFYTTPACHLVSVLRSSCLSRLICSARSLLLATSCNTRRKTRGLDIFTLNYTGRCLETTEGLLNEAPLIPQYESAGCTSTSLMLETRPCLLQCQSRLCTELISHLASLCWQPAEASFRNTSARGQPLHLQLSLLPCLCCASPSRLGGCSHCSSPEGRTTKGVGSAPALRMGLLTGSTTTHTRRGLAVCGAAAPGTAGVGLAMFDFVSFSLRVFMSLSVPQLIQAPAGPPLVDCLCLASAETFFLHERPRMRTRWFCSIASVVITSMFRV